MLDARERQIVLSNYQQTQPGNGEQYEAWCEEMASVYGFSIRDVKMTVAGFVNQWHKQVSREYQNHAARIADMIGAGLEQAVLWAAEVAGGAYKEEVVYDQGSPIYVSDAEGNAVMGPDGQKVFRTLRQPDFNSRTRAIDQLLKMHGAYAPEKKIVELNGHMEHSVASMSRDEIIREIEESGRRLRALAGPVIDITASLTGGTCSPAQIGAGVDGAAGNRGSMVLVDGMHQDDGRAGQRAPLQALPEEALPPRSE